MKKYHTLAALGFVSLLASCRESSLEKDPSIPEESAVELPEDAGYLNLASPEAYKVRREEAVDRATEHLRTRKHKISYNSDHRFIIADVILDKKGSEHVRYDRRYKGLKVLGGDLVIHSTAEGEFDGIDKAFESQIDLDIETPIAPQRAIAAALKVFVGQNPTVQTTELMVFARGNSARLAYEVVIEGVANNKQQDPSERHIIVDARTALVLDQWEGIQTISGSGRGFFVGSVPLETKIASGRYQLSDPLRGNQSTRNLANKTSGSGTLLLDTDNIWGNFTLSDTATLGVDAQFGAAVTWDLFLNRYQRRGLRNNGIGAMSRVHYGRKYNNAFWSDSCFCMTYGDGDGTTFNPFTTLDIAGHEMSHGLTSVTAKLVYSGESGGLNEATSDIFGTLVEFYANNSIDKPDYLIGERLYRSGGGKALRYMHKPSLDGRSPDCYSRTIGTLGVHNASGVANHFFYLLAEGSLPTNGLPQSPTCNGSAITGIGRDAAGAIWYRALTVYMNSGTNYAAARLATLNAARDIFTDSSAQYQTVAAAWSAVGVN